MIFDTFLFYNELELLDIRLHELNNIVDRFVLVEGTVTHTNKLKPLFYNENKSKFKKFHNKIIHIIVDDSPDVSHPWIIERFQLEAVMRGLRNCKSSDTILFGAVDEIPNAEKIIEWKEKPGKNKVFLQKLCYYFLNCCEVGENKWLGSQMFSYKNLLSYKSPYIARFSKVDVKIPDGGWHFSYMGGVKRIQQKIASMAHQEFNNEKFNTDEKIMKAIYNHTDLFNRGINFKIETDEYLPKYVRNNKYKFKELIVTPNDKHIFYDLKNIKLDVKIFLRNLYKILRNRLKLDSN